MNVNDPRLLSIGVSEIPPGQTEDTLIKKLLQDQYFWNKCLARLVSSISFEVAQTLPHLEREALSARLVPPKVKPQVEWSLVMPESSIRGVMSIIAKCGTETVRWEGNPKNVRQYRFHGEAVPLDIVLLYEQQGPPVDPDVIQERKNRREEIQYKQDQQNKVLSREEIMVLEQYGKHPQ